MEWSVKEPKPGDMIRTKVKFYYHYGIYINDNTVVQFGMPDNTGVDPDTIAVLTTNIDTFNQGTVETALLSREEAKRLRKPQQTADYALSQLGRTGYNILHNNCELFANECMFGETKSHLLDGFRDMIRKKAKKED